MFFNLTAGRCAVLWTTWIYKSFPMYILEVMYSGMPNKRIVCLLIFGKTPCLYVLFGSIRLLNFRIFAQPIDHLDYTFIWQSRVTWSYVLICSIITKNFRIPFTIIFLNSSTVERLFWEIRFLFQHIGFQGEHLLDLWLQRLK